MKAENLRAVVEAILFVADEPQSANRIAQVLDGVELSDVKKALDKIRVDCEEEDRGIYLFEVAGGFQMGTKEKCRPHLDKFFEKRRRMRLSTAALETLAIVAYRQPLTRAEIEAIRGVNVDGVVHSLLERRLIKIAGRKEAVGNPFLYRTTREFLQHFGLRSLSDLPQIEALMKAFTASGADQEGGEGAGEGGGTPAAEGEAPEGEGSPGKAANDGTGENGKEADETAAGEGPGAGPAAEATQQEDSLPEDETWSEEDVPDGSVAEEPPRREAPAGESGGEAPRETGEDAGGGEEFPAPAETVGEEPAGESEEKRPPPE
jgi:segregation and condensation protein B